MAKAVAHGRRLDRDVEPRDADLTRWAAACNIHNQERLFSGIRLAQHASGRSREEVAGRLGIGIDALADAVTGRSDLTMTELRLLSAACDVVVDYRVTPVTLEYRRQRQMAEAWQTMVDHLEDRHGEQVWDESGPLTVWEEKTHKA